MLGILKNKSISYALNVADNKGRVHGVTITTAGNTPTFQVRFVLRCYRSIIRTCIWIRPDICCFVWSFVLLTGAGAYCVYYPAAG
jgi:hypothetical protein